jgi:uncharacterized membrane protein YhhN
MLSNKGQVGIYALVSFVVVLCAHLRGPDSFFAGSDELLLDHPWFYGMVKSSLMLTLLFFALVRAKEAKAKHFLILVLGIVFSLIGDALMLANDFFLLGLFSFLLAHIAYIILFIRSSKQLLEVVLIRKYPLIAIGLATIAGGIFYALAPHLKDLALPVFLYVLAILGMAIFAVNRYGRTSPKSFRWVMAGALFFMFSDSIIAFDRFQSPIPFAPFLIMSTYATAQGLIVFGILEHFAWEEENVLVSKRVRG